MWTEEQRPEVSYIVGTDIAQGGADYTALCVLQQTLPANDEAATYDCIWLDRWNDRRTARIPEALVKVWRQILHLAHQQAIERTGYAQHHEPDIRLVVDITGVGPFGSDPLRRAGFEPTEIVIHGGDAVSHPSPHVYRVPKRDLAGSVSVLLESGRLKVANALPAASILRAELANFRAKISLTGHDSYGAGEGEEWREGAHDDLVLAVAVAAWLGESRPLPVLDPLIVAAWADLPGRR